MIPAHIVDQVLQTAVIEEVIGDYVSSKVRKCPAWTEPLHKRENAFYVLPEKGIFKCFSSDKGGSVVTFLMELDKLSFPQAIKHSLNGTALYREEGNDARAAAGALRAKLARFKRMGAKLVHRTAAQYGRGKGHRLELFRKPRIPGRDPEDIQNRVLPGQLGRDEHAATEAGYTPERLLALGLTKDKDGKLWDFFKGRVMFPIRDLTGRSIAFRGRTQVRRRSPSTSTVLRAFSTTKAMYCSACQTRHREGRPGFAG